MSGILSTFSVVAVVVAILTASNRWAATLIIAAGCAALIDVMTK